MTCFGVRIARTEKLSGKQGVVRVVWVVERGTVIIVGVRLFEGRGLKGGSWD
jgi:hypothetical protein